MGNAGMISALIRVCVQSEPFDSAFEQNKMTAGRHDIGAVVAFTGLCRSEDGTLVALELEHYPGMAEAEMLGIAKQAASHWPLSGITAIHRVGRIAPGEEIVLVIASSRHRGAAFAAAEYVMDYLKSSAPFWKKEHRLDGSSSQWVEAKDSDDTALARWQAKGAI